MSENENDIPQADIPQEEPPIASQSRGVKLHKPSIWEVYYPFRAHEECSAIYIASFPKIIYFWPAMITFFTCGLLQKFTEMNPATLAGVTVGVFAFNILVIVQDFDQKKFLILILAIVALGLTAYIINIKGFTQLSTFIDWMRNLDLNISAETYFLFASVFFFFFCWGMIRPLLDHWRIENNEFVHFIQPVGRDMSIPRQGSTVSKDVPDVFEYLLTLGGGSLVIKREGRVWAVITDVPFLGRRMKAIDRLLSTTRVTMVQK